MAGLHEGESGVEHGVSTTLSTCPVRERPQSKFRSVILSPLPVVPSCYGDGAERKLLQCRELNKVRRNQRTKIFVEVRKEEGRKEEGREGEGVRGVGKGGKGR